MSRAAALPAVLLMLLAACGQRGDLYHPGDRAAERRATGGEMNEAVERAEIMREARDERGEEQGADDADASAPDAAPDQTDADPSGANRP